MASGGWRKRKMKYQHQTEQHENVQTHVFTFISALFHICTHTHTLLPTHTRFSSPLLHCTSPRQMTNNALFQDSKRGTAARIRPTARCLPHCLPPLPPHRALLPVPRCSRVQPLPAVPRSFLCRLPACRALPHGVCGHALTDTLNPVNFVHQVTLHKHSFAASRHSHLLLWYSVFFHTAHTPHTHGPTRLNLPSFPVAQHTPPTPPHYYTYHPTHVWFPTFPFYHLVPIVDSAHILPSLLSPTCPHASSVQRI